MIEGYAEEIVLTSSVLGGVGDLALWSTLPERFSAHGHKVYIDQDNIARNQEIFDLFWTHNPFVLGQSDKKPNTGYTLQGKYYDTVNTLPLGCAIEAMERAHGLPPPYSLAPKIYYTPKPPAHDVSKTILMDLSALSSNIHEAGWELFHRKMVDRFGPLTILRFPQSVNHNQPEVPEGVPQIGVNSIYEYCDLLAHCRAWVGSEAGGQALAAAVRGEHDVFEYDARPEIVCLMSPGTFNSRAFCFRGVDYRCSKFAAGGDYLDPAEVPLYRYHLVCKTNVEKKRAEWEAAKK